MTEFKDELIEALLGCPTVVEFERRDALVRQLPENIRHNLKITNVARIDVIQLVDWCMNYQNGVKSRLYGVSHIGLRCPAHIG